MPRWRRRITDGPLGVIVLGREVDTGRDFAEIDFIDVLNLKGASTTWAHFAGTVGPRFDHDVGLQRGGDKVGVEVFAETGVLGETGEQQPTQRSKTWQNCCFSLSPTFFNYFSFMFRSTFSLFFSKFMFNWPRYHLRTRTNHFCEAYLNWAVWKYGGLLTCCSLAALVNCGYCPFAQAGRL